MGVIRRKRPEAAKLFRVELKEIWQGIVPDKSCSYTLTITNRTIVTTREGDLFRSVTLQPDTVAQEATPTPRWL